jgi:hypothetical protein
MSQTYRHYIVCISPTAQEISCFCSKCSYLACFGGTSFVRLPRRLLQWKPQKILKPRVNTHYHCAIKQWRQWRPIRIEHGNNNKIPKHNNGWCHYSNVVFVLLCLRNVAFSAQNNIRPCKTPRFKTNPKYRVSERNYKARYKKLHFCACFAFEDV